jgi:hypothetical protein
VRGPVQLTATLCVGSVCSQAPNVVPIVVAQNRIKRSSPVQAAVILTSSTPLPGIRDPRHLGGFGEVAGGTQVPSGTVIFVRYRSGPGHPTLIRSEWWSFQYGAPVRSSGPTGGRNSAIARPSRVTITRSPRSTRASTSPHLLRSSPTVTDVAASISPNTFLGSQPPGRLAQDRTAARSDAHHPCPGRCTRSSLNLRLPLNQLQLRRVRNGPSPHLNTIRLALRPSAVRPRLI